jgi:hypothetical protein
LDASRRCSTIAATPARAEKTDQGGTEVALRGRVDEGVRALLDELQQGKSERLLRYLEFTARFHRYSVHNQILIYLQYPQATFVAGYRRWQELGYLVRKGERGIRILAPRPYQRTDPETNEKKEAIYFVSVPVFDDSQLANVDEKPLPSFFTPLADDQQELYARLVQVVQQDGIHVAEDELGLTQGYSIGRRIAVRAGLDSRNRFLTLLHEYTHELLHWNRQGREQPLKVKECHAEAISYVVAHHFGIHNPFSADYMQQWGNTDKEFLTELDVVRRGAAYIIERLETSPDEKASADGELPYSVVATPIPESLSDSL